MPTSRAWCAAASGSDGRVYVIGGHRPDRGYLRSVEAYDPSAQTWEELGPLRCARSSFAAVAWADQIFVFGGERSSGAESLIEALRLA